MKFCGLSDAGELFGSRVTFARNSNHPIDPNCVGVMVIKQEGNHHKLGHIAAEAAKWLSAMLLGPFDIKG